MNMTDSDWAKWLHADGDQLELTPSPTQTRDTYYKEYLYKEGRGTPKAQFFMTSEGINGSYGFWCPRSAIISDNGNTVEISNWCKLTEIEYNRGN